MGLILPVPTVTLGPEWAIELDSAFDVVDAHDHTTGKGVLIPSAGIGINGPLDFNDNDATDFRSVRFSPKLAVLTLPADLGCLYVVDKDLYFNDGDGNHIRFTIGGAIDASSVGGISGMGSTTASVVYTSFDTTFSFYSDSGVGATLAFSALKFISPGIPVSKAALEVETDGTVKQVPGGLVPTGVILDYGGGTAPAGYLVCDGTSYLRATYPDLFTALGGSGSPWGIPDGTHFNVPDFRRAVAAGSGGSPTFGPSNTVGSSGGAQGTSLTEPQLAVHSHGGQTQNAGTHAHSVYATFGTGIASTLQLAGAGSPNSPLMDAAGDHFHIINDSGAGSPHNNYQPTLIVLKIIKT